MNITEMIKKMANDAGISEAEVWNALESLRDGVFKSVNKKEGKVSITGFGTFLKNRRKARTGRNLKTGEQIKIEAKNSIKFKPSKKLKDAV